MIEFLNKRVFFVIGLPLSGKTTLATILSENITASSIISTGEVARNLMKKDSFLVEIETAKKDFYPQENLIREAVYNYVENTDGVIIVEGMPRSGPQMEWAYKQFSVYMPVVIEAHPGDLVTVYNRAKMRGRDVFDLKPELLDERIKSASKNLADIQDIAMRKLFIPYLTIMTSGDRLQIASQIKYNLKSIGK